jgi:class 3 adenylate cyclase
MMMEGQRSDAGDEEEASNKALLQLMSVEVPMSDFGSDSESESRGSSLYSSGLSDHWLPDVDAGDSNRPLDVVNASSGEEFEDDKAEMLAVLMKNHASFVSSSLVGRSSMIQSVVWLSRHVPGCVLKSLLDAIKRARREKARVERRRERHKDRKQTISNDVGSNEIGTEVLMPVKFEKDDEDDNGGEEEPDGNVNDSEANVAQFLSHSNLPISNSQESALLFVDISGFTQISQLLDVESLSRAINSYFQMIINEVLTHGGDILKFAGDAIFCQWTASQRNPHKNLQYCVLQATKCAASIVGNCSDYAVTSIPVGRRGPTKRGSMRSSVRESFRRRRSSLGESSDTTSENETMGRRPSQRGLTLERNPSVRGGSDPNAATLNVKCGIGVGRLAGVHVGDDISRREFIILGDPIDQVSKAEAAASHGEVFASPEVIECLVHIGTVEGDWERAVKERRPFRIALREEQFFNAHHKSRRRNSQTSDVLERCDSLDCTELRWLKRMISLYAHPVVVNDDNETSSHIKNESDYERHLAEAELRNVYTCFISPLVDYRITGDEKADEKLFNLLNDIMNLARRHLDGACGHLRQFIVDDKGVVLIFTFGLRGSTFPNMIAQHAIPVTLSICASLFEELGVKSTAGATFGKVYCGVVGGLKRHEFAVLGPSVNLAARLMSPKTNSGVILVDKNVRILSSQIFFKPLPAVNAKGYADPVPIFEPVMAGENEWGHTKRNIVGRDKEMKEIMHVAKDMALSRIASKFLFVSAASGTGKSTLMVQSTERVRAMVKRMKKRVIVTRNISNDGDSRVPFSLFRSIFRDVLLQVKHEDELRNSFQDSKGDLSKPDSVVDFSVDEQWDSLSLRTLSSKNSTMSTEVTRFRYICEELNAPPEFVEVVGKRLLGLKSSGDSSNTGGSPPDLSKIVNFMADAFIRCTKHADLVLLALDDVHWMDDMSWKVVQAIFERGQNVLTLIGSRPPSTNPLTVDKTFWSELQNRYRDDGRYIEISLQPFNETEVQQMIALGLGIEVNEIDSSFWRNVFTTSGGMPHYLSYVLETIKRNDLTVKLDNGLFGLKSSEGDDSKVGFSSFIFPCLLPIFLFATPSHIT